MFVSASTNLFGRGMLLFGLAAAAAGQPPAKWFLEPVLPEPIGRSEMYAFVNANIPPLPRFSSLEHWTAYKARTKQHILQLLGIDDILRTHRLKVTQKGRMEGDDYWIEKINFESYPGMFVPAIVYVPKKVQGRAPAIVSISGHSYCESKAEAEVQARNCNLVKRGFVVISYDYFGCFERGGEPCKPGGQFRVSGRSAGWDHLNSVFSYTGRTPAGVEVLDGIRAVDYLYSRPDVDRSRIAFTGGSGGGHSTYWVSALDERITLSVPVSTTGSMAYWIKVDRPWDWHQRPIGLRAFAGMGTLLAFIAPRPLLVINGRPELASFALPGAMDSFNYARAIYRLYGKEDHAAFQESVTGHGYQPDKRVLLYGWLQRWFFGGRMPHGTEDLPFHLETRDNLTVGLPPDSLTVPALYRRWIAEIPSDVPLPADADEARKFQGQKRRALDLLLCRTPAPRSPRVVYRDGDDLVSGVYKADRLQFEVAPDLLIPGLFVRKQGPAKYKTIVVLGKNLGTSLEARGLIEQGYALMLLDVRGTGEMDWGGSRTSKWASFVGRPPIGMWTQDISQVITYLLSRPDVEKVAMVGYNLLGKTALYAAALDERVAAVAVTTDTLSYRQEATSGLEHVYADVPHILTWGDMPQLAALVAPRPLAIFSAGLPVSINQEQGSYFMPVPRFDVLGARVSEQELKKHYGWTRRFYAACGRASNFETGTNEAGLEEATVRWLAKNF
ncbi:MAG: acetylxylan esterase [Candidatus Solibacter sp.]|jgi:dienelactone hydrolase